MRARNRSIRFKIASILLVPLASLVGFWMFALYTASEDVAWLDVVPDTVGSGNSTVSGGLARLAIVAGLGLVAVVASIVIGIRVARPIVREMRGLSAGTRDFADRTLPLIAERLRRGEATDGDVDAPTYSATTTETAELLESFVAARRVAVQATVQEAAVRNGVGAAFINLARRNQALLHRQLGLLDTMERQTSEPEELENLLLLDQLATRMRRHAESLVILSGAAPGRGWRNPAPLVEVIRKAIAEVEDYARVTVSPIPHAALAGPAVADTIHLLAELVENATLFSPPHTNVRVDGQLVGNGFAIEIEDRGLGMSAEDLAKANEMLGSPPEFDLSDSSRLGFFVIGRLAARHVIKVSLRASPYGGTTAIVLIPWSLVAQNPDAAAPNGTAGHAVPTAEGERPAPQPVPALSTDTSGGQAPPARGQEGDPARPTRDSRGHAAAPGVAGNDAVVPTAAPTAGDPAEEAADAARDLPRRKRQANAAPQLRAHPQQSDEPRSGADSEREPGQVRTRMAAIQQGWVRGRSDAEPPPHSSVPLAGSVAETTEEEGG